MLKGEESFFGWEFGDEKAGVLAANCLSEKVKIAVAPLDFYDSTVR